VVLDWGLGKQLGMSMATSVLETSRASAPIGQSEVDTTQPGLGETQSFLSAPAGTFAYMAPEQLEGRAELRSDVFGLGAILYEILTGRAPYEMPRDEVATAALLNCVRKGQYEVPHRLRPDIPRALEAICVKALAVDPRERYPSAGELGKEVQRYLADEPVAAYREPWLTKARRWAGQHQRLVASLVAGLLVGSTILALAAIWLKAANESERKAKEEARRQFDQTVITFSKLASLTGETKSKAEAINLYEYVLGMVEQSNRDNPADSKYQEELARLYSRLGLLYFEINQPERAEATYLKANDLLEALARAEPANTEHQGDLAENHANLAVIYASMGRNEQTEKAHGKATDLFTQLIQRYPSDPTLKNALAAIHNNLALKYQKTKQFEKAEQGYKKGLQIRIQLIGDYPDIPLFQSDLAVLYINLGGMYNDSGRKDQAKEAYETARGLLEKLVEGDPSKTEYKVHLGITAMNLGNLGQDKEKPQDALEWFAKSVQLLSPILQHDEQNGLARSSLREAYEGRAQVFTRLGRHVDALPDWEQALGLASGADHDRCVLARALTLIRLGQHKQGTGAILKLIQKGNLAEPMQYEAARVYALAADVVLRDPKLSPSEKNKLGKYYVLKAVQSLIWIQKLGFFKKTGNLEGLKKDPDFDAVRGDPEFGRLIERTAK